MWFSVIAMSGIMRKDDIVWAVVYSDGEMFAFSVNTPYLYSGSSFEYGKLMYSTINPFGEKALSISYSGEAWHKISSVDSKGKIIPKTDQEIQSIARSMGFLSGVGVNRSLSELPSHQVRNTIPSRKIDNVITDYDAEYVREIVLEACEHYGINEGDIHVAGSLNLFPRPLQEAHDVDMVIFVDSESMLEKYSRFPRPRYAREVFEFGKVWPLRWWTKEGFLICPFFVYRKLPLMVESVELTEIEWAGQLIVKDARYSLFELIILETISKNRWVIVRNGALRGEFFYNQKIYVRGCLSLITSGQLKGEMAIFVDSCGDIRVLGKQ